MQTSTPTGSTVPKAAKACCCDQHASNGVPRLPPSECPLNIAHPPPSLPSSSPASKSFSISRELSQKCVYLSVKVPGGLNSLRLISSPNLFAPLPVSTIDIAKSCALALSIFVSDRPFISTSLIHSDRRDFRWSSFSNSSTYLLRTLSYPCGCHLCSTTWSFLLLYLAYNILPQLNVHLRRRLVPRLQFEYSSLRHLVYKNCLAAYLLHIEQFNPFSESSDYTRKKQIILAVPVNTRGGPVVIVDSISDLGTVQA